MDDEWDDSPQGFRQATRRRGHFPNEQAALKVLPGHPQPDREPALRRSRSSARVTRLARPSPGR
jgi:hypothetical protein